MTVVSTAQQLSFSISVFAMSRIVVAMMLAVAAIAAASDEETLNHRHLSTPAPPAPPTPSVPTAVIPTTPVPTSPAPTPEPCSCCDLCNIVPGPPVPTSLAPTEPCSCCDLCNIVPGPFLAVPGGGSSSAASILPAPPSPPSLPSSPVPAPPAPVVNCVTALAGLAPCSTFLAGRAGPPPMPQCGCCNGLSAFLASARAAGPVAGGQRLQCLCPILHGEVNLALPKPVDPVRMVYLPVACGLALPPETISLCFGQHMPTMANLTSGGVLH